MGEWFSQTIAILQQSPVLQGVVAAFCTFILEDLTSVTSGLLVADGKMDFAAAFLGLTLGITTGDFGLYLIGRLAQRYVILWRLINRERLERGKHWFHRNMLSAVLGARFMPGVRMPAYVAAGVLHAPPLKFLVVALIGASLQTTILLFLAVFFGRFVLSRLGVWEWPVAGGVILAVAVWHIRAALRRRSEDIGAEAEAPTASAFEFWPPWLFYIPVAVYWFYLAVRYRGLMLPTVADPSIYSSGIICESKSRILELVANEHRRWVADYVVFDMPEDTSQPGAVRTDAEHLFQQAGLGYPVVAKPDIGHRGAGVRPIHDARELEAYLGEFPGGEQIILQELVSYPREAGILYHRIPGDDHGDVMSVTLKEFPTVEGDGVRTLRELILADDRARLIQETYFDRHRDRLEDVLAEGEQFRLVFSGNHCQGTIFKDGTHLLTKAMIERFHDIATGMPAFYFGRFDVRFEDLAELQRGKGFRIVEINGAGAEATHIWDSRTRLRDAYATLFNQFRLLFRIGSMNRRRGHRPTGPLTFLRDVARYNRKSRHYPSTY
ncbi:MAG: VTT domain-containing protein [Candidatus Pacebacteria bacterium]|nr:VTT domain-containing protein [Candidatus Paceibacterota bacterium]